MSISIVAIALGAGTALASPPERLRRIEQGIDDMDTLAVSLRVMSPDLRSPAGFTQLFEDTANPGTFVRVNGATYAVMPRTEYALDEDDNVIALVPAGTVFYLGGLPTPDKQITPMPAASRGVARSRAMPVRSAVPASDIMLAQLMMPSAIRAIEAERARASDQRLRAARIAADTNAHDDLTNDETRAHRLREISARATSPE